MTILSSAHRPSLNEWLGQTVGRAALVQTCAVLLGMVMLGQSIYCGLQAHHGHALLCSIGAMINYLTYVIAGAARREAGAATMQQDGNSGTQPTA
jgi:hypothetical protein